MPATAQTTRPEPDPFVAALDAENAASLTALADNRAKAHQVTVEPLRAAKESFHAALKAKTPDARRVTHRFRSLPAILDRIRVALDRPWPFTDACQRALRNVTRWIDELDGVLRDPVEAIARMIDERTLDDFRYSTWPQEIQKYIEAMDRREQAIEQTYREVTQAFKEFQTRHGAQPVRTVRPPLERAEPQAMVVVE